MKSGKQRTGDDKVLEELLGEDGWDETYADNSWEEKGKENRDRCEVVPGSWG